MKKIFQGLGVGLIALALSLSLGVGSASADLTVAALAITSSAALTLDGAVASNVNLGAATTSGVIAVGVANTGGINIGAGNTAKTIAIGTGTAIDTINIGTGATGADVITVGGGVGTVAVNSGDWDISTTGAMTGIGAITADGALILSGGTGASNALATIGTLVTDAGVDVSANVGRLTGLQINLLNSGATVTGFRAIDARVTDNGTAANAVAVQGLTTKASGVSTGEAWTGNFILTITGGKYEDEFGVSSDVVIGATSSVGSASSPAVNNLVAGRFSSYVDTSATLSAVVLDVPILSILNGGANNRAKADAAVMAMIDGGSAGTVTAER